MSACVCARNSIVKDRTSYFPDKLHFFKTFQNEGTNSSCNWMQWQFHKAVVLIKAASTSFSYEFLSRWATEIWCAGDQQPILIIFVSPKYKDLPTSVIHVELTRSNCIYIFYVTCTVHWDIIIHCSPTKCFYIKLNLSIIRKISCMYMFRTRGLIFRKTVQVRYGICVHLWYSLVHQNVVLLELQ